MAFREVQIGNCRCINADMEDVLPTLDTRSAAIVTDPPYGIAFSHGGNDRGGIGRGVY